MSAHAIQLYNPQSAPAAVPSIWISITEARARSGIPERTLRRRCQRWRATGQARTVDGDWKIDPTADDRFRAPLAADAGAELLDIRQVSAAKRSAANIKREIVRDLQAYVARRIAEGADRVKAIDEFAAKYGNIPHLTSHTSQSPYGRSFSRATLYRWLDADKTAPITGLVDKRGLCGTGARTTGVGSPVNEPEPDVIAAFQQLWLADTNRGSLKSAYRKLTYLCDQGGKWFFGSYRTFCRWVEATYPKAMVALNRDGEQAYRQNHEPSRDQDPEAYAAGEMFVGDHHQFRHVVWHAGKLIRPWLTAWMDQRSLLFVGYVIVPEPNQTTILAAARHACVRFGPSKYWLMDNGRDYSGYALSGGESRRCYLNKGYLDQANVSGLIRMLQGQTIYCLPHSPNSKIIEGQFKVVEESFGRALPNYCGADPEDRPHDFDARMKAERERPAHARQWPDLAAFALAWSQYLDDAYANEPSHGKYCRGRSPRAVFDAERGPVPQLADPRVLDLLSLVWSRRPRQADLPIDQRGQDRGIVVTKNGVRFQNLQFGKWQPEVIALQGKEVLVTYDPSDISSVGVWDLDYRFICRADANPLFNRRTGGCGTGVSPATDEDRREGFRLRNRLRKALTVTNELGHLRFADNAELALAAQQHAQKSRGLQPARSCGQGELPGAEPPAVRLVQTPLDGQMDRVQRAFARPCGSEQLPALPSAELIDVPFCAAPQAEALPELPAACPPSSDAPEVQDIFERMREVPHDA